ncbi:cell wall hydrolase [Sphingomonas sp. T1]|uniref:cell wall hydrolase n=1 Tax=Sphingomonas sp. T1 TaxID=2653172 RepID=UPI001F31F7F6|nr:cell wall hydrolase [Sphingomonas sp. T1]
MNTTRWASRSSRRRWLPVAISGVIASTALFAHAAFRYAPRDAGTPLRGGDGEGRHSDVLESIPGDFAAPVPGVTGTIALPKMPIFVDASIGDPGVVAGRPFSMTRTSAADRARALFCLTTAIYYEAASEPDAGQRAVAQVILNRVRHPAFPASVCGVVYQGPHSGGAPTACQFSFACDGATAHAPARLAWVRAERNAAMALAGYVYTPVGLATHYHTYAVTPLWSRSLVMTAVVGAHFFHRWKGYWGTAAAFNQHYLGGEPLPGRATGAAFAALPTTARPDIADGARGASGSGVVMSATVQTNAGIGSTPAEADRLPPAPEILDRWKDTGGLR